MKTWISIGLNVVQALCLLYLVWKIRQYKLLDTHFHMLKMRKENYENVEAARTHIDGLNHIWEVRWEAVQAKYIALSHKIRNFFSVGD